MKLTKPKEVTDVESFLPLANEALEAFPWLHPCVYVADGGYDSKDNYEKVPTVYHGGLITPLTRGGVTAKITGTPIDPKCEAGLRLIYRGLDKTRGLKYQCPEKAGQTKCTLKKKCAYGNPETDRFIWLRLVHDYRQFGGKIKRYTPEWDEMLNYQPAIERYWSRLKKSRILDDHCFRHFNPVNTHALLAVIVMQAVALANAKAGRIDRVRMEKIQIS